MQFIGNNGFLEVHSMFTLTLSSVERIKVNKFLLLEILDFNWFALKLLKTYKCIL